jgi:hypothetical protein
MEVLIVLLGFALFNIAVWLWGFDSRELGHNPATREPTQRKV